MEETLGNGITMLQPDDGFRLGTDSVLLAQFLTLPPKARVIDIGSGCGTLGLLLCARDSECTVLGLELQPEAHTLALQNIRRNGLERRLSARLGDARQFRDLPAASFDCVISNPPYFPVGSGKVSTDAALARSEQTLPLETLCRAAAWLLPTGGRFALVHRPERLCDLFCALRANGLEPKRVQFVRHRADRPVCLVLVEARRGAKPALRFEPDFIEFEPDGTESDAYRAAYHRGTSV